MLLCQYASNLVSSFDSCASDSKLDLRFITSWPNSKVFFPFFFSPFYSLICYVMLSMWISNGYCGGVDLSPPWKP